MIFLYFLLVVFRIIKEIIGESYGIENHQIEDTGLLLQPQLIQVCLSILSLPICDYFSRASIMFRDCCF